MRPSLLSALSAGLLLATLSAAPLDAQYRRGVLVYDSNCPGEFDRRLTTGGGAQVVVNGYLYGVLSLDTRAGVRVTMERVSGSAPPQSVFTTSERSSVLYTSVDEGPTCAINMVPMATESLVTWAQSLANGAEKERRSWARIRNLLFLGGVAVLGATAYNFNNEVERDGEGDAVTLIAGTALGLTITYLGFNEAQPEVTDYRRQRDRYRDIERQILERAR